MKGICITDHAPSIIRVATVFAMERSGKCSWERGVVSHRRFGGGGWVGRRSGGAIRKNDKETNIKTKQKIRQDKIIHLMSYTQRVANQSPELEAPDNRVRQAKNTIGIYQFVWSSSKLAIK